ncbi:DUF6482 family protein [Pseudomonas sp. GCEP-101]|uniref:DUF6482 family protein n=1 Tax=Pseudomonas sp. GCEP-101 TaxID=2974552 RepID=UPI00223AAC46|nr:DUF6482 family protein [Pseudomonas sp. GCEP-101]
MTMQELAQAVAAGRVRGFETISLEGGFYVVQARLAERSHPLRDAHGEMLHLRSIAQVRDVLREWASLPCELVQHCVHDEIGATHPTAVPPLRVALSLEPRE